MTDQQVKALSPYHRDAFEIWGNQWKPGKVMAGTCERCVWGRGGHARDCVRPVERPTIEEYRRDQARAFEEYQGNLNAGLAEMIELAPKMTWIR